MEYELSPNDKCYLSESMQKCFPQHSCIEFDTSSSEEHWNKQARDLWQTGYSSWQHNLSAIQGDSK